MKVNRNRARRGVILLVILGLLAMFGLVAVAFVVSTGQALRTAEIDRRISQYDLRAEEDLHEGFMIGVRGPKEKTRTLNGEEISVQTSVMGPHGLLEDMCSSAMVTGKVVQW